MEPFTSAQWQHLDILLDQALARPLHQRVAFLTEACAGNPSLRAQALALLKAGAEPHPILDDQNIASMFMASGNRLAGRDIGPYHIIHEIDHGGMGTVYLAERADGQFKQSVALKLLHTHLLNNTHFYQRFLNERQILAGLQHPHIARLFDGGLTEEGCPYFVMELVEGLPLTSYCDHHSLSLRDRLHLFRQVCQAVSFAHRNLIVHRDLKPANILVTEDGQVKLLDFGIAKLLAEEDQQAATRTGLWLLTPEYAAPEQVAGRRITTATDVYALGVVLYELLTGQRPYAIKGLSPLALHHMICDQEIERPSENIVARSSLQRGGITLGRLRKRLAGDLDRICLMALRKEAARRYATAEALGEDILRYLRGLPVEAQKDTMIYRSGKFVRRHRVSMMVSVMMVFVLAAYTIGLVRERDRSAREAHKAEEVTSFLVEMFRSVDPTEARGAEVTARELLAGAVERIEGKLEGEPEVKGALLEVMGVVHQELGMYEEALGLLEEALTLQRSEYGEESVEVAQSLYALGGVLNDYGKYEEAEQAYHLSLQKLRKMYKEDHLSIAASLNDIGAVLLKKSLHDEAESYIREALSMRRRLLGEEHEDVAESLEYLGNVLRAKGMYTAAEQQLRLALGIRQELYGDDHPDVAFSMDALARILRRKGAYTEAEQVYREALTILITVYGDEHYMVARGLSNLATVLENVGRYDEAELLYREALIVYEQVYAVGDRNIAITLDNLGLVFSKQGAYEESERVHREALAMFLKLFGEENLDVAISLDNLGLVLSRKGAYEEAEPYHQQALIIMRNVLGEEHPRIARNLSHLGLVLHGLGKYDQAEERHLEAIAMFEKLVGKGFSRTSVSLYDLGVLYMNQGRAGEAEPLLREALSIRIGVYGEEHVETAEIRLALGRCLTMLGAYDEAEPLLKSSQPST